MKFEVVKDPSPSMLLEARMHMAECLMSMPAWEGEEVEELREKILAKLCELEPAIAREVEELRSFC